MIDKADILKLQELPIERVALALGLEVRRHKCLCPFHDDSHPSLTFSTSRNRYRCYVCDARGGTIDLVMNTQHWPFYDSCKWLADKFDVYISEFSNWLSPSGRRAEPSQILETRKLETRNLKLETTVRSMKPETKFPHPSSPNLHYLESLISHPSALNREAERFLFEERRLDPQVVAALGLRSISNPVPMSGNPNGTWFNAPSLLIPYRDIDGRLLSVQARYLGNQVPHCNATLSKREPSALDPQPLPRFQFPKGSRCSIYNLPILRHLEAGEPLFVTEGCSDCWSMLSSGHKAIAIPSATLLNDSDLEKVVREVRAKNPSSLRSTSGRSFELASLENSQPSTFQIHIFPDQDKAGEALYERLLQASLKYSFTLVRHQLPAGCKDFSEYYLQRLIL